MRLKWFKHFNTASEGQLIGDLLAQKQYEAALLVYIIMEFISRYQTDDAPGKCSVPIERLAQRMNMKPSRTDRLLARISAVSQSDLICETDEKQPRNRVLLMRNWSKLQKNSGGKREQNSSKIAGEVRSEIELLRNSSVRSEIKATHQVENHSQNPEIQTPRLSSAEITEMSFAKDFQEFKTLCQADGLLTSPRFRNALPQIYRHFGDSLAAIRAFAADMKTSPGYLAEKTDQGRARYLRACFEREVGLNQPFTERKT